MRKKALIVVDIQKGITKNYKNIIANINRAVDWASQENIPVLYIRHENCSPGAKTLKPNTVSSELAEDLKIVSEHVFTKHKTNALSCTEFKNFLEAQGIQNLYIVGADAAICLKSTCFNLRKLHYKVNVLSDCITSWDKKRIPEMLEYYVLKGCVITNLQELESL